MTPLSPSPDRSRCRPARPISAAQPAKMLAFTGVRPGMKVLDMEAGAGYSTELLARAVAPAASSTRRIPPPSWSASKDKFDIRAQKPAMKNVVHVVRNFDDPIPPDVSNLDLITFFFAYHDTTYMPVDRAEMNKKMFAALKPGGFLVIADHSARPGDGTNVGEDAASDRGKHAAPGDRGGRLQARGRRRFPASSRRPARRGGVPSASAERRVRAEIPEAAVRRRTRLA